MNDENKTLQEQIKSRIDRLHNLTQYDKFNITEELIEIAFLFFLNQDRNMFDEYDVPHTSGIDVFSFMYLFNPNDIETQKIINKFANMNIKTKLKLNDIKKQSKIIYRDLEELGIDMEKVNRISEWNLKLA